MDLGGSWVDLGWILLDLGGSWVDLGWISVVNVYVCTSYIHIYAYIYIYIYFLQCMNFVHFVSRVLVRLGTSPIRLVL